MKREHIDGRLFLPELTARSRREGNRIELLSPAVGYLIAPPPSGSLVGPGTVLGEIEVLGVRHRLRAPADAVGLVLPQDGHRLSRTPVQWADVMLVLDPEASPQGQAADAAAQAAGADEGGLAFVSPLSGRYYARPGPGKPTFVNVGDTIETGQTVALLEVMKTFNRVTYGGDGLPARAKVLATGPTDEDDVDEGDVLLRVEPV